MSNNDDSKAQKDVSPYWKKGLPIKKEKFARALVETGSLTEAAAIAKMGTTRDSHATMGARMAKDPAIRTRVAELLDKSFPDHEGEMSGFFRLIKETLAREMLETGQGTNQAIKLMELYAKLMALEPPKQTQNLNLSAKFKKLPGE